MNETDNTTDMGVSKMSQLKDALKPREKAMRFGIKSLSDIELMAIIFGTGVQGKGVLELCEEILDDNKGHLSKVAAMSTENFIRRYKGIGPAKALTLMAALELGARSSADGRRVEDPPMSSSMVAYEYMQHHLSNLDHEEFWVLFLKQNNKAISELKVGQGGLTSTLVDVRIIVREALSLRAASMILFHNHPSGSLKASPQDIDLTRKIKEAAGLFEIRVLDHIIVGNGSYLSLNDKGFMPR